jgi:FkbM family methyltransferase
MATASSQSMTLVTRGFRFGGKVTRKLKTVFFTALAELLSFAFFLRWPSFWQAVFTSKLSAVTAPIAGNSLRLVNSNPLLFWRTETFFEKEPETLAWISEIGSGSIFFDVGANVGVYSLFAAKKGATVYSFEPESANYAILNENIRQNRFSGKIKAFCLALSDESLFDSLRLSTVTPGAALHSFGEDVDGFGGQFRPLFEQGCVSFTLDELVYTRGFPCPKFLKIDVDGLESKIVRGASKVLKDPRLESVLIEVNRDLFKDQQALNFILESGFQLATEGEAVYAKSNSMKIQNLIFKRKT